MCPTPHTATLTRPTPHTATLTRPTPHHHLNMSNTTKMTATTTIAVNDDERPGSTNKNGGGHHHHSSQRRRKDHRHSLGKFFSYFLFLFLLTKLNYNRDFDDTTANDGENP
jgi:hypothetical protein